MKYFEVTPKKIRNIIIFLLIIYAWLDYYLIYHPFILPNLSQWNTTPFFLIILRSIPILVLLVSLGQFLNHKGILCCSCVFPISFFFFDIFLSYLKMPGFRKPNEGGIISFFLAFITGFVICFLVMEISYTVKRLLRDKCRKI